MAINKILGDMLASNLERSEDLAIETDLIYVDVANNRVGVNTNTPVTDFSINGNASVSSLTPGRVVYVGNNDILVDDGSFTFDGTILTVSELSVGTIDLGNLAVTNNTISATNTNGDIILSPNGLGNIILNGLNYPKTDGTSGQFLTTDGNGNLTFATVSQSFDIIADDSTADTINTGETIVFAGGEGIETSLEPNLIRISGQRATYTNRGIASFNSTRFSVNSGAVDVAIGGIGSDQIAADAINGTKIADDIIDSEHYVDGSIDNVHLANSSIVIGSDTVSLGSTITDINGLTSIDIDNITVDGNTISSTDTNGNIVIAPDGVGVVDIDTTSGMIIPVGTTAERSVSPTAGEIRWNTDVTQTEIYNGTSWVAVGAVNTITTNEFDGDNSTTAFTLSESTEEDALIVSINGTLQEAGVAYTVSGSTLTFAEAPLTGDRVQARNFFSGQSVIITTSSIVDADNDTKIQVEESADEDTIRFDIAGTEKATMTAATTTVKNDLVVEGAIKSDTFYFVKRSTNTSITYPGSYSSVTIDYEDAGDDYGSTDAMWSSSTDRFTPTVAGLWYFRMSVDSYSGATQESGVSILKNGSVIASSGHIGAIRPELSTHVYMNGTTDYIQFQAYTQSATTRGQSAANSFFEALLVKQAE